MLAAVPYMLVFRSFHILAGVLWVGSAFLFAAFIGPAAGELGPAAAPLLENIVSKRKVSKVIEGLGGTTLLAGLFLYWHDWHLYGSFGDWITAPFGVVLTIGAVLAIAAFSIGVIVVGHSVEGMAELSHEVGASGGPPTPEQAATLQRLQERVKVASQVDLVLLVVAVLAMSTARYW